MQNLSEVTSNTISMDELVHKLVSDLTVLLGYIYLLKEKKLSGEEKELVKKLEDKSNKIVEYLKKAI